MKIWRYRRYKLILKIKQKQQLTKSFIMNTYLTQWAERYRADLTENIMPFWLKYGLDRVNGGIYTCVDRDGSLGEISVHDE